jgi:hypothetical protein
MTGRLPEFSGAAAQFTISPVSGNHWAIPFGLCIIAGLGAPITTPREHHGWYCDDGVGVSAAICSAIAVIIVLTLKSRNLPAGQTLDWDPVSLLRSSSTAWLILLISFALGFWWKYRKAKAY